MMMMMMMMMMATTTTVLYAAHTGILLVLLLMRREEEELIRDCPHRFKLTHDQIHTKGNTAPLLHQYKREEREDEENVS